MRLLPISNQEGDMATAHIRNIQEKLATVDFFEGLSNSEIPSVIHLGRDFSSRPNSEIKMFDRDYLDRFFDLYPSFWANISWPDLRLLPDRFGDTRPVIKIWNLDLSAILSEDLLLEQSFYVANSRKLPDYLNFDKFRVKANEMIRNRLEEGLDELARGLLEPGNFYKMWSEGPVTFPFEMWPEDLFRQVVVSWFDKWFERFAHNKRKLTLEGWAKAIVGRMFYPGFESTNRRIAIIREKLLKLQGQKSQPTLIEEVVRLSLPSPK